MNVGGVAEQKDRPLPKPLRDTVVHSIGREPVHPFDTKLQVFDRTSLHILEGQLVPPVARWFAYDAHQSHTAALLEGKNNRKIRILDVDVQLPIADGAAGLNVSDVERLLIGSAGKADREPLAN